MIYQSKFTDLIVSGCSFTHNNHESHCTWGNTLAYWANMNITNLAVPGAGNAHIKNSIILHLEKHKPPTDSTLVIVIWSGPERIDWITDKHSSNFSNQHPFSYQYTDTNELVLSGSWWAKKIKTHLNKTLVDYSKYQSNSSLALQSWIYMQDLENYLKAHNYQYYFTSWFGYNGPVDQTNRWIDYDYELQKLGLERNQTHWLINQPENCLGNWSLVHPEFLWDDNFHVTWQGHEAWLTEILIPELIKKNVLDVITELKGPQ